MRRRRSVSQKVREMVRVFGGKRATVRVMGAASSSSLKRWERKECSPLRAHVKLVDETYSLARRMGKVMLRKLRRQNGR